ncbi:MAG: gliding motility-associated C-terminal domain-containing protein [Flavobacteriales bacterium]|nr:gliding motility-associated C-terminal domain-containing protein [Flavobacteriales bacterium]
MRSTPRATLAFLVLCAVAPLRAQLTVDNTLTPEQLVQNVLLGGGVTATNITFNKQPGTVLNEQAASFNNDLSNVGIPNGVLLATGTAGLAIGPNNMSGFTLGGGNLGFGDPDLALLSGQVINDAAILEFDFVVTGDSLKFNFVCASEEYLEFVNSINDAFGFFLSGPGIFGPFSNNAENIALIPGTTDPVTINSVNNVLNPGFYVDNGDGFTPPFDTDPFYMQFDGRTVPMTARAQVICGETYHIKLVVGDASDAVLDSGVFLEGGSFVSNPFVPALEPGPGVFGDIIYESCFPITLNFVRVGDISQADTVYMTYGGTSTPGVDYSPELPDTLAFLPGEGSIPVFITVPVDGDGDETIEITILVESGCNGQPLEVTYTFYIHSAPPLVVSTVGASAACGEEVDLAVQVSGGFGLYDYLWSTGGTDSTITINVLNSGPITVTVTDTCGFAPDSATALIDLLPAPPMSLSILGDDDMVEGCDSLVLNVGRPIGATGDLLVQLALSGATTNGTDHDAIPAQVTIPNGDPALGLPVHAFGDQTSEPDETATVTASYTNVCAQTVTASVDFTIVDADPIVLIADNVFTECSEDSIPLLVQGSGGNGGLTFQWGEGTPGNLLFVAGDTDGMYVCTATDDCGVSVSITVEVDVDCEILIPNVFSPNNDGANDRFEIEGIRSKTNTVRIFNRWGQMVFETSNYNNQWDGDDLPDGTYFYEVLVEGVTDAYTGHLTILNN